jgi:hypothetical protein
MALLEKLNRPERHFCDLGFKTMHVQKQHMPLDTSCQYYRLEMSGDDGQNSHCLWHKVKETTVFVG